MFAYALQHMGCVFVVHRCGRLSTRHLHSPLDTGRLDIMTGQENTKINTLQKRYGLASRQAVYDRINGLGIKPIQKGELSALQLDLLDKLDKFLKENSNNAIADFPKQPVVESAFITHVEKDYEIDDPLHTINWLSGLVEKLAFARLDKPSPLAAYRELEEAVLKGWVLPTATVAELVGTAPTGEVFVRGNFVFSRAGKVGRSCAWKVSKLGHSVIQQHQ